MKNIKKISKHWFLLLFVLFPACGNVINNGFPDDSTEVDPPGSFNLLVKNGSAYSSPAIDSVYSDSGEFISGSVVIHDNENIWLTHTGIDSVKAWEGVLGSSFTDRVRKVKALDQDDVLVFADRLNADLTCDIVVAFVNLDAGIRWQHCIGDEHYNNVHDAVFTDDGCILVSGTTVSASADSSTPFFMKIDILSGNVLWCLDYRNSDYTFFIPHAIIRVADGTSEPDSYLAAGTCIENTTGISHVYYMQLDASGKVTASRYVYMPDADSVFNGFFISQDIGDEKKVKKFVSMIKVSGSDGRDDRLYMLVLDGNLEITKVKYDTFNDYNLSGRLVSGEDGDFYYAGLIKPEAGNGLYVLRYNKNGNLKDVTTRFYSSDLFTLYSVNFISAVKESGISFVCSSGRGDGSGARDIFFDRIIYGSEKDSSTMVYSSTSYSKAVSSADTFHDGDLTMNPEVSCVRLKGNAELKLERWR